MEVEWLDSNHRVVIMPCIQAMEHLKDKMKLIMGNFK